MGDGVLTISDTLSLPLEAVTETFAIIGKRGMGKTATGVVLAEELIGAGQPTVVFDPTGVWWGLRSSADGENPGLPVVIVGGEHGDLPLHEGAGELLADLVVTERVPLVLDLSLLSKSATRRFAADFLTHLYRHNREPLHLIVDEADLFAPQRWFSQDKDMPRLIGAMNDIVRRGRVRGIGVTLISQRPAVINKDVLSQIELLVALRLTGRLDRDAVDAWIDEHADGQEGREVKDTLSSLPVGTAWIWSPGWLGILLKVMIRRRHTYDSSATPKPGQRVIEPRRFADVDLDRLRERLTAPADDPAPAKAGADTSALRRQITQLAADLTAARAEVRTVTVEVPALAAGDLDRLDAALAALADAAKPIADALTRHRDRPGSTQPAIEQGAATDDLDRGYRWTPASIQPYATAVPVDQPARPDDQEDRKLTRAETKVLTVLAQHGPRTTAQVALLTGYSGKSGGFRNTLSSLRTAGRIDGQRGGTIRATITGLAALGAWEPLPTGAALVDWWNGQLALAERKILAVLVAAWPDAVPTGRVADLAGYSATSGGFRNACSRLRTLGLADGQRGELRAADELGP